MKSIIAILGALGAGAALMYLFDPKGGNRRRAIMRDKAVGLSNDMRQGLNAKAKDLSNRAKGMMHEAKSMIPDTGNSETEQSGRLA